MLCMLYSFFLYLVRFCVSSRHYLILSVFVWVLDIFILTFFVCVLNILIFLCTFCMSVIHFHYFAFFVWVLRYTFLILSTSACILEIVQHIFCSSMLYTLLRSPLFYTFIITSSREKVKCSVKYMYSMATLIACVINQA